MSILYLSAVILMVPNPNWEMLLAEIIFPNVSKYFIFQFLDIAKLQNSQKTDVAQSTFVVVKCEVVCLLWSVAPLPLITSQKT